MEAGVRDIYNLIFYLYSILATKVNVILEGAKDGLMNIDFTTGHSQKGTSYNQEVINLSAGFEKLTLCLRLPIEADVFENLVVSEANVVLHVQWRLRG